MTTDVDLSEFEKFGQGGGPGCATKRAKQILGERVEQAQTDKAKREARDAVRKFDAVLKAAHIPSTNVSRWLAQRQVKVGADSLNRHRRGECTCDD